MRLFKTKSKAIFIAQPNRYEIIIYNNNNDNKITYRQYEATTTKNKGESARIMLIYG